MNAHGTEVRQKTLALLRDGAKNTDVARRFGVPPGTVSYWKHVDRVKRGEPVTVRPSLLCPRCNGRDLDKASYSYLLGLYLGDGHISHYAKHKVPSLMITLDDAWPGIQDSTERALRTVFPHNATCRVRSKGAHNIKVYFKHLDCLFPQHGPGKKHERPIVLEPWQQEIVDAHPWEFVRGLIPPTAVASPTGRPDSSAVSSSVTSTPGTSSPMSRTTSGSSSRTPWTSSGSTGRTAPATGTRTTSPSPRRPP